MNVTTQRKPVQSANARRSSGLPLAPVRRRIWEQACDLAITGDQRDLAAVLANRFKVPQRAIHLSIIAEGMTHERAAATFKTGAVSLLAEARQARSAVESELAEVA